jgi:hypothetical protein
MEHGAGVAKGVVAGAAGAGVLGVCTLALGWPVVLGLVPSAVALAGTYLVLSPRGKAAQATASNEREFKELVARARGHIRALLAIAGTPAAKAVAPTVEAIAASANGIVDELMKEQERRLPKANTIEGTLGTTRHVLERYVEIVEGKLVLDDARKTRLLAQVADEFLPAIRDGLADFARRMDEGDVIDLEASIKSTLLRLQLEGL